MKKIFTFVLLCAAMLMNAANVNVPLRGAKKMHQTVAGENKMMKAPATAQEVGELTADLAQAQYFGNYEEWYLTMVSFDETTEAYIYFFSDDNTNIAGKYSSENDDFDIDYCEMWDENVGKYVLITDIELTITSNGMTTSISGSLTNEAGNKYTISFEGQLFGTDEVTEQTENTNDSVAVSDGVVEVMIDVMDEEGYAGVEFYLVFNAAYDKDNVVAEGVYTINASGEQGTVLAEVSEVNTYSWYDGDDYNEPGYYYDFNGTLVGGKVTVSATENGTLIEVNGWDYVGSSIYASYEGKLTEEKTAIKNTTATIKAEKSVRNGQLIIKRQNVEYNALGAIVK